MAKCSKYHAKCKVTMPKCSKYHAKWQVLVPNCCKYKANGTRKESQDNSNLRQNNTKNYATPIYNYIYTYYVYIYTHTYIICIYIYILYVYIDDYRYIYIYILYVYTYMYTQWSLIKHDAQLRWFYLLVPALKHHHLRCVAVALKPWVRWSLGRSPLQRSVEIWLWLNSMGAMVDITWYQELVNGVYKLTYNWGAPSCTGCSFGTSGTPLGDSGTANLAQSYLSIVRDKLKEHLISR